VLALVMTGMGSDGLEGAKAVRSAGGTVLAQDEATSAVWGMPGRVAKDGLAAALVPLGSLAGVLIHKVMEGRLDGREERLEPWPLRREVAYGVL
jgi:two-component system chemotaxis response regulator CheB